MGSSCVECQGYRGVGAYPHHLASTQQNVHDPAAQAGVESLVSSLEGTTVLNSELFRQQNKDAGLEAGGDHGKGEVEYVRKHTSQLHHARSDHLAWNVALCGCV